MKKIIGNIADLTDEYIKKNEPIGESYVKELKNIIVSHDKLEDYVKSLLIKRLGCASSYDIPDVIIYFDLNRQLNTFNKITEDFYDNASKRELNGGKYLFLAQTVIHECDHAKQCKKCRRNKPNLETKILRSIYAEHLPPNNEKYTCNPQFSSHKKKIKIFYSILDDILYNHYYDYAPEERLADIESYKKTLKIAKLLGLKCSYKYHSNMLYDTYLDSYDQKEPSTIYYLMKTRRKELAEELKQLGDLPDFDIRLKLGLSLTKKELKKLESKRDKID